MNRKCVVIKFGGATLSDKKKISACADKIIKIYEDNLFPIVVVSAMGNNTQTLSSFISNLTSQNSQNNIFSDFILSTGEMVSAGALSIILHEKNYKAHPLCGWQVPIVTNNNHGNAQIQKIDLHNLHNLINQNIIPIITGFQGISNQNQITILGKGTSDLTAVALAASFDVDCYIYKNVNGIFTCDPNSNKGTKISKISYDNFHISSIHGAEVVCEKAIEYAKKHNVKIFVQSAFDQKDGTIISDQPSKRNMITSQEAFVIMLNPNDPIPKGHAFISYDKQWCLFSDKNEFLNHTQKTHSHHSHENYTKITLIHPNQIDKEKFLQIANKYSQIYSLMNSYSWICVPENQAKELENKLLKEFVENI